MNDASKQLDRLGLQSLPLTGVLYEDLEIGDQIRALSSSEFSPVRTRGLRRERAAPPAPSVCRVCGLASPPVSLRSPMKRNLWAWGLLTQHSVWPRGDTAREGPGIDPGSKAVWAGRSRVSVPGARS